MFKYTIAALSFLGFLSNGYEIVCPPNVDCVVNDANASTIIIANNSVTSLTVNCLGSSQCKKNGIFDGLIVYSSAITTFINCDGEDSCEECQFNFGIAPPNDPEGYDGVRDSVTVSCGGKQSCKNIVIDNMGVITNGLTIDTPNDPLTGDLVNTGAFMGGLAECGTLTACSLECGSNADTCKEAKCYGSCICTGSSCPDNFNQPPTPQPTQSPSPKPTTPSPVDSTTTAPIVQLPTPEPTPSPTNARNTTACDMNGCILTPGDDFDVICGAAYTSCTVDCSEENQCANGVVIDAQSANVLVLCGAVNSCDKLELFVNGASAVTVEISAEKAASNMLIAVENLAATVTVDVTGKEGFNTGKLFCDGECTLNCPGEDACKDTLYECLNTGENCNLLCDSDNNQCPFIQFFGDQSCPNTPNAICEVTPDGSSRIVALNNVDTLIINCDTEAQQCKGSSSLKIFSAARNTILKCGVQDGCEDAQVCVGDLYGSRVPKGFKDYEFNAISLQSKTFVAQCNADSACKGLKLLAEGGVSAILDGEFENSLQDTMSRCVGCESLEYLCREFDGCIGSSIKCSDLTRCSCVNEYAVDMGNDTAVLATTEAPRDSCPEIMTYQMRNIAGINNGNSNVINNNVTHNLKYIVPVIMITTILLFCFGIIIKRKKSYSSIDGQNSRTDKFMKNENIYATYQVEMH